MSSPHRVPSVEEIKNALGQPTSYTCPPRGEDTFTRANTPMEMTNRVNALQQQIRAMANSKRMSPAEIREGLDMLFQKYDFHPVEKLIQLAVGPEGSEDPGFQARICMFLTEFLVPKLRSVEVSGTVDHVHTVVVRRFGPHGIVDVPIKRVLPAGEGIPA
jgi:hypothetical protein